MARWPDLLDMPAVGNQPARVGKRPPADRARVRVQTAWARRSRAGLTSKSAYARIPWTRRASSLRACETKRAGRLKMAKRSRFGWPSSSGGGSARRP